MHLKSARIKFPVIFGVTFLAVVLLGGGGFVEKVTAASCIAPNVCDASCPASRVVSICTSGESCCSPATGGGPAETVVFKNPLAFNTVEEVLTSLLGALQGIIVVLSLIFIIIGAFFYITSAGNEKRMETAKSAITASMIGLAIGIAAPSFLKEIGTILGWGGVAGGAVAGALTLSQIATRVLNFLLSIIGIIGIIMLTIGGMMYMTAAGDEDRIATGKKIVVYAIIGIIVAMASLVIVSQIAGFFA